MTSYMSTIDTAPGPFTIVVDDDGAVLASGWTDDVNALLPQVHASLRSAPVPRRDLGAATKAALAYHRAGARGASQHPGQPAQRRRVPADRRGRRCARSCRARPVTYTELASRTGNPAAVRAAAQACARNAVALFVPCHRVIRTDGTLGGFRWGLDVKRCLIAHERGG